MSTSETALATAAKSSSSSSISSGDDWLSFVDPCTGRTYMSNPATYDCVWGASPLVLGQTHRELFDKTRARFYYQDLATQTVAWDPPSAASSNSESTTDASSSLASTSTSSLPGRVSSESVAAGGSGAASASAGSGSAVTDGGEGEGLEGFARVHFSYGKKVSRLKSMLQYQKEKLSAPLLRVLNEKANGPLAKKAVAQFKNVLCYCGDKNSKVSRFEIAAQLCAAVHEHRALADELLCQVGKQTVMNPRAPSLQRAWELMALLCRHVAPSDQLRSYLLGFLTQQARHHKQQYASLAAAALRSVRNGGPYTPQTQADAAHLEREIAQLDSPFLFGAPLAAIMERERAVDPSREVPYLVEVLLERIIALGGDRTEGIFRIPGDVEFVAQCSFLWEAGDTSPPPTSDPRAAASLLSLWLRSLADPLVPDALYDAATACKDPAAAVEVAQRMPVDNRALFLRLCKFFGDLAVPENAAITKMNVPNLAMVFAPVFLHCPSDNPSVILQNSKLEHSFLTHAINGVVNQ
eukprot:CAMPEP_0177682202 /NCGR_PEP_ID=MMETSP0447-20121125/31130_1 /TAXON_ID=0 /ORGANISM="Stygamoeba regulata, Strain BSH-02190019" /LENGTH=522 /DNA_ID=CAMNT_0019191683 /DNA_START=123 /DNA_END=1691 /DNA_ORIENTATION=-